MSTSVRVGVNKILGADPDPAINPVIWQELMRLRIALLSLASAVDERNAAIAAAKMAAHPYQTTGLLTHAMYLSELTKVKVPVSVNFGEYPQLTWLSPSNGRVVASLAYDGLVDAVSVYLAGGTGAGGTREFILKGMYVNAFSTVQDALGDVVHSRLSSESVFDNHNRGSNATPWTSYDFRGQPTWLSGWVDTVYGYYKVGGFYYMGHIIGAMPPTDLLYSRAKNALVYFNPRRQ